MSPIGHNTRLTVSLGLAALCLPLAGCATYHSAASNSFSSKRLADAGTGGGIQIQVDGKVGGMQGAPLAAAIAAAMPATVDGTPVHYVACDPYTECPGDHLVFTFGPPAARPTTVYPPALAVNFNLLGYHPAPNNVTAKLALFQGGNAVTSIAGQTNADSPSDPAFQSLIGNMSSSVLSGPDVVDRIGFP
ncbi:MAG: hypothetical protein JWM91_472 [Rhodospirillales bacterium]|nr:hypothetical protein [Rhodospirillales bacterium]